MRSMIARGAAAAVLAVAPAQVPAAGQDVVLPAIDDSSPATSVLELVIDPDGIQLEIECGVPDLVVFEPLFHQDFRERMGLAPDPDGDRRRRFLTDELVIRADGGDPLAGEVVAFQVHRRSSADLPPSSRLTAAGRAGQPVVLVIVRYPLSDLPEVVSVRPPPAADRERQPRLGLAVSHRGMPVSDLVLVENTAVIDLDWDDPRRSTLRGAPRPALDSPLAVVLAVGPRRTRIEIVVRPIDLEFVADVAAGGPEVIPVEARSEIAERAATIVAGSVALVIDGRPCRLVIDRAEFVRRRLRDWSPVEPDRTLDAKAATLAVELVVPTGAPPRSVTLEWSLFPGSVDGLDAAVIDPESSTRVRLTPEEPLLRWNETGLGAGPPELLAVPPAPTAIDRIVMWGCWTAVAAVALALIRALAQAAGGARSWAQAAVTAAVLAALIAGGRSATTRALVDDDRAARLVTSLLHNAYLSRDGLDEQAVLIDLERRSGEDRAEAGTPAGDDARIGYRRFEMTEIRIHRTAPAIVARCAWRLTTPVVRRGELRHRVSRYLADVRVDPVDGAWRINAVEIVGVDRL